MRSLPSVEVIDTPNGTSRRSLFRKALAAAAGVAGAAALLDFKKRPARAANGDFWTVGNLDPLLGPDTSSNTTELDKDNLINQPNVVLTNANGAGLVSIGTTLGTHGLGTNVGSLAQSAQRGVEGQGGDFGVIAFSANQAVRGQGGAFGVFGSGNVGVNGAGNVGISGQGSNAGVLAIASAAGSQGVNASGVFIGVHGVSGQRGVQGDGTVHGVLGFGGTRGVEGDGTDFGVIGFGTAANSRGVHGVGPIGVVGQTNVAGGTGVSCIGNFVATGTKSAAVPYPDGSHRLLYAMESPESWFEDFGSGALAGGRASVDLAPDFAAVVNTADYRVFLTPEGDSRGLYVSSKSASGFTVNEQQEGTSSLAFSYRVVARRKDVDALRLAKFSLPAAPSRTEAGSEAGAQGAAAAATTPDVPEPSQVSPLPQARRR